MSNEVPGDWHTASLRDVVQSLAAGVSVNADNRSIGGGEVGVLKTSCVSDGRFSAGEHKTVLPAEVSRVRAPVRAGSIIISRMNTPSLVGANAYVEEDHPDLFLPDRLWELRTNDHADCRWLSYFMQSALFRTFIDDIATGTSGSMKNISKERLLQLPLCLPPFDEQQRIAEVLRSVDAAIIKTEAVCAAAIKAQDATFAGFLSSGNCDGGPAIEHWTTGKISSIKRLPKGWNIVRLIDLARLESGHTPDRRRPEYWDGGDVQWISLHDTQSLERTDIVRTELQITEAGLANSSARLLPAGTVCFSRTATVGKCVIMAKPMATSQDFANFVCSPTLNNRYLLYLMRWMQPVWKQLASGSTHKTIYMPTFKSLQIIVPPRAQQDQIADAMDGFVAIIEDARANLAALHALKKSVTLDLFSGRVRVPA